MLPAIGTNLLPEVAALPSNLIDDHKACCNLIVGDVFRSRLGKRGKKSSNGKTFTHDFFVGAFCDELYPDLSEDARQQYWLILGPVSHFLSYVL